MIALTTKYTRVTALIILQKGWKFQVSGIQYVNR